MTVAIVVTAVSGRVAPLGDAVVSVDIGASDAVAALEVLVGAGSSGRLHELSHQWG